MHPRQAFVKHEKVALVQKPSADPASASGTPIPDDVRADSSAQDTPGTGRRTPAKSLSSRWQKGGGGVKARSSVPGHGRLLFEERAGGTMISASVPRELAARFQMQTVLALQVRFRGPVFHTSVVGIIFCWWQIRDSVCLCLKRLTAQVYTE